MKELSQEYINSMLIGFEISKHELDALDATEDWKINWEYSTIAELCSNIRNCMASPIPQIILPIMNLAIVYGFRITDHGMDDYCRGFAAGLELSEYFDNSYPYHGLNEMKKIAATAESIWQENNENDIIKYREIICKAIHDYFHNIKEGRTDL